MSKPKRKGIEFFVFSNDNELFQLKRLSIVEGEIAMVEMFQIDEESAQLASATVTAMECYEFVSKEKTAV